MKQWMCCMVIAATTAASAGPPPTGAISVEALVRLIEHIDVPAGHEGKLERLLVKEGAVVSRGELLGQIDARQAELTFKRTQWEQQLAAEKAKSEIAVNLAKFTKDVSQAEFERAKSARQAAPGSLSNSEFDRLRLEAEKASQELARVTEERRFATIAAQIKTVELQLSKLALEERQLAAPLDGLIVQVYRHEGEWVQPGEKVVRIVRIDRLRVEAFVDLHANLAALEHAAAMLHIELPDEPTQQYEGKIVFVNPEADPVNGQIRVWAEIDNRDRLLRPGQRGRLTIQPKSNRDAPRQAQASP